MKCQNRELLTHWKSSGSPHENEGSDSSDTSKSGFEEKRNPSELVKSALAILRSAADPHVDQSAPGARESGPEALAVSILAENEPGEVDRILTAWREFLGIELDRGRVISHLKEL